eukprot:6225570-Pyramimonas_sp.AAC.1
MHRLPVPDGDSSMARPIVTVGWTGVQVPGGDFASAAAAVPAAALRASPLPHAGGGSPAAAPPGG